MATAIDWGFYSGWLRLQIDRENRQALFDVMAEIPHLQLGNFVSGTVYLLACRTVQSLGVKVTGQKNMLHHLNPAELSQLGSKLPTTEIKTFDDFDKIIPNGKEVILKIIDNIIDDLKGIAGSTLRSLIIYLTADILTYPLLLVNTRLTAQYPFEEPKYKGPLQTFQLVATEEGFLSFYKGFGGRMMRRLVSGVTYLLGGFFVRNVANEFERSWRYVCASLDIATNEPNPTALSQSESDAQSSEPNPIVNIEQRQPVPIYHVVHLLLRRVSWRQVIFNLFGATSAFLMGWIGSYPFEVVSTRTRLVGSNLTAAHGIEVGRGLFAPLFMLQSIYQREGLRGMFKGFMYTVLIWNLLAPQLISRLPFVGSFYFPSSSL
jgi:hypothetical protein